VVFHFLTKQGLQGGRDLLKLCSGEDNFDSETGIEPFWEICFPGIHAGQQIS
jgi:hypothetical protein